MPACRHAEARGEKETKSTKPKPKAKVKKEAKKQSQGQQRKKSQKASQEPRRSDQKGRPQKQQPNSPTHYEPLGSVPGPQLSDLKRQEGSDVMALATPAVPPAADCGTAPPCGGRLYGGTARGLTFGLLPNLWIKQSPIRHLWGMKRNATPATFFTERTLATYLAVSDRTIRNWIRRGELPSYKLGAARRIDPADVDAFLAQRRDELA
jgi:excisionase family DNA binding protein